MRIDLTFHQLDLCLGTDLPEFFCFFPLPPVFPEKEMNGIEQVKKKIDQAAVDNVQFIWVEIFLPAVIMYHRTEKEYRTDRREQGYPISGNEKKGQEPDLGLWGQEFFLKPGLDQPVSLPGYQGNGENGQSRIIPFDFNPEIMIHIADNCIKKSIQCQQQNKQVSVSVIEHFLKIKAALFRQT